MKPGRIDQFAWISLLVAWAAVFTVLGTNGCGGTDTIGTDIKRTAAERPDIDRAVASSGWLVVPAKTAFNISSVKSAQTGTGRGSADLVGNNGAKCGAEARDGGSAWGEFQLGYCFDNVASQPLQAAVKLRLKATGGTSLSSREHATTQPAGEPAKATTSLIFFIKDSNGIVQKKEQLFSGDLEKGAGSNSTAQDLVFDAHFEPQRGYYLVVAGRVDAQSAAAQNVVCSLDVADCAMEIDWQPAAPAGAPVPAVPGVAKPPAAPTSP